MPHRVISFHACNSCRDDPAERFSHHVLLWRQRHADTPRRSACSATLRRIPGLLGVDAA